MTLSWPKKSEFQPIFSHMRTSSWNFTINDCHSYSGELSSPATNAERVYYYLADGAESLALLTLSCRSGSLTMIRSSSTSPPGVVPPCMRNRLSERAWAEPRRDEMLLQPDCKKGMIGMMENRTASGRRDSHQL